MSAVVFKIIVLGSLVSSSIDKSPAIKTIPVNNPSFEQVKNSCTKSIKMKKKGEKNLLTSSSCFPD